MLSQAKKELGAKVEPILLGYWKHIKAEEWFKPFVMEFLAKYKTHEAAVRAMDAALAKMRAEKGQDKNYTLVRDMGLMARTWREERQILLA